MLGRSNNSKASEAMDTGSCRAVTPAVICATKSCHLSPLELVPRINGMQIGSFQEKGVGKAQMEDRMIVRAGIPVESIGASK